MVLRRVVVVVGTALACLACGGGDPAGDALVADGVAVREVTAEGDAWRWAGTRGDRFCTGRVTPGLGLGPLRLPATFADEVCDPVGGTVDLAWTCEHRDDGASCRDAGLLLQREGAPAALPLLERACGLGEGAGCRLAGVAHRSGGLGAPRDAGVASGWLEKGCNLSDDRACAFRGALAATPENPLGCGTDADKWYRRGGPESKVAWGEQLAGCPDGDPSRARGLWKEACEGGSADGCRTYGYALRDGVGGPIELGGAAEVFRGRCHAEPPDLQACVDYGLTLVETGHPDGGPRALAAFQKACDAGNPLGCRDVGVMLREGQLGVHADGAGARLAFQKACDGGDADSCGEPGVTPPP
jgi:TPR repeat protein